MFMGVTFCDNTGKELKGVINTDCIKILCENKDNPNTTMVTFKDDTPAGLIKGSYEENAKILFGFNRKL